MSDQIERDRVEPVNYVTMFEGVPIRCEGPTSSRLFTVHGRAFSSLSEAQSFVRASFGRSP